MQLQQAQMELAQARSRADEGLYQERVSRVQDNKALAVERLHKANSEDERALLDKVKILKELETMDIEHIERLLGMATLLKQQESNTSETAVGKIAEQLS